MIHNWTSREDMSPTCIYKVFLNVLVRQGILALPVTCAIWYWANSGRGHAHNYFFLTGFDTPKIGNTQLLRNRRRTSCLTCYKSVYNTQHEHGILHAMRSRVTIPDGNYHNSQSIKTDKADGTVVYWYLKQNDSYHTVSLGLSSICYIE